jgi:hypothetical protein
MIFTNTRKILPLSQKKQTYVYAQVILFGPLYFLVRKHGHCLKVRLHFSGDCYVTTPIGVITRAFKKRLVLYGEKERVINFLSSLMELRMRDVYTGTGLRQRTDGYIKKPGKVSRR